MVSMQRLMTWLVPKSGFFHKDTLSGLTVALALVPEAIAFALVAHVNPLVGLYAAFFMCFITAVLGGRPGMISGATGSMAVVMVALVNQYGVNYLFAAVILTGVLQIIIGLCRLGQFIQMLPKSVMVGFVNGLAIVIFLAQLQQFKVIDVHGTSHWLQGHAMYTMAALVLLAMAITHYLPKFTKAVPSALTAIVVVSLIVLFGGVHTRVVADMMAGHAVQVGLPHFAMPSVPINWHSLVVIVPYAVILSIIGLSESLMTLTLIDERTQTAGNGDRECIAQGIGNIVSGFFKSMGGCAMIGQSMINITSGGRGRLSGIVAGLALLFFIIVGWPLIQVIPLAALVGVMFMVVIETFEWTTFEFIRKIPLHDALIIVVVTVVTVATDLAVAVVVGVIMAALTFAWQTAKKIYATTEQCDNQKIYRIHGPLFFGAITSFKGLFTAETDPQTIIIDFADSRVADHSAIDAIRFIDNQYTQAGKLVSLRGLSFECMSILNKAGIAADG